MYLSDKANYIIQKMNSAGFQAYAVGGCVRDSILGIAPKDWDICTNALPEQTKQVFIDERTIDNGIKHGTLCVVLDKEPFEITTFRVDGEYKDNRRPENVVFVSNIENDLLRRDFTINAMAYSEESGIIDLCSSQKDLKDKIIRTVGDSDTRFGEDALRIMRGVRFSAVFGFDMEKQTRESAFHNRNLLKNIAAERLNVEFSKLILAPFASKALLEFHEIISVFIGDFDLIPHDVLGKLDNQALNLPLRLAFLLMPIGNQKMLIALKKLKYSNHIINSVMSIAENYDASLDTQQDIKKLFAKIGKENLDLLLNLKNDKKAQDIADRIVKDNECVSLSGLALDGNDLIAMGVNGKNIGIFLNDALNNVLEGRIKNDRDALVEYLKDKISDIMP